MVRARCPRPSNTQAPPQTLIPLSEGTAWSEGALGLPINHQDAAFRPWQGDDVQSALVGGMPSRLTIHMRNGAHSPKAGGRADSNAPKVKGGNREARKA